MNTINENIGTIITLPYSPNIAKYVNKYVSLLKTSLKLKPYLKKANLKGYRTITNVSAEFNPGLNIIIGQNGSGKTNFLTFLYDCIKNPYKPFSNQISKLEFAGNNTFSIEVQNSIVDPTAKLKNSPLTYETAFSVNLPNGSHNFLKADEFDRFLNENELNPIVQFIPHGIRKENKIIDTPYSFIYKVGNGTDLIQEWLNTANSWFARLFFLNAFMEGYYIINDDNTIEQGKIEIVKGMETTIKKFLESINENIVNFLPIEEVRISPTFRIFSDTEDDTVKFEGLALEYYFNNSWLPFSSLSDGTKRLFCLYADIAIGVGLATLFRGTNKQARIILVEEPELGIHPHQFHKIMLFLKEVSTDAQIIMTTHSPQALNIFSKEELDSINICTFDIKSGTSINRLNEAEVTKAKAFMDEMYLSDYWVNSTLNRI